jgi:DNA-binding NarL/FixJ family response regulator
MNILIVDDQRLFSDTLKNTLEHNEEHDFIVTVASRHDEVFRALSIEDFDIILMDIHMPEKDGIVMTKDIIRLKSDAKILILTAFGYDDYVKDAMKAGAVGFLLKDITSDELVASILGASAGTRIVSPSVFNYRNNLKDRNPDRNIVPEWYNQLSHRNREILIHVMRGYSNEEIADTLHLSNQTVKNYLSVIYSTLNVKNRFQAMRLAMRYRIDQVGSR